MDMIRQIWLDSGLYQITWQQAVMLAGQGLDGVLDAENLVRRRLAGERNLGEQAGGHPCARPVDLLGAEE